MNVLVIGGAGFIGSHTVDALLARDYRVRVLDSLAKPVHQMGMPDYLPDAVEFIKGDVRDKATLGHALKGIDVVYNFAAYQDYLLDFSTYFHVNTVGTALIFEIIVEQKLPVQKVIVATSQAVAGEGLYQDLSGRHFTPDMRPEAQLARGEWDIFGPDGKIAQHLLTPESVSNPTNAYGMSKLAQELATLNFGRRYDIPSVSMRYSIVQGPRQSFYNAYSGACRIFCLGMYFDRAPILYEDGLQIRDFVNIHDVVDANMRVLDDDRANYRMFNVGGGRPYTVKAFAEIVRQVFDKDIEARIPGHYRYGDTRHIISDIRALQSLGWTPQRDARFSVEEYVQYLRAQTDIEDILAFAEEKMKDLAVVRKAT